MKYVSFSLCLAIAVLLLATCYAGPDESTPVDAKKIRGVWSIETMDTGTVQNRKTIVPKAFMIFITEKHYSAIRDLAEKSSTANSKAADAGTYEFDGKNLVVHHMASAFPALGSMTFKCSMEGDNILILEPQYHLMKMPGMEGMKPSADGKMGYGDMAVKYRFKRLE
ncbi:MAG: hypothetical protein JXA73_19580 [Acidobacteria bacterium]|nr:hypothetical protein [Acidobacteriota bacterium]